MLGIFHGLFNHKITYYQVWLILICFEVFLVGIQRIRKHLTHIFTHQFLQETLCKFRVNSLIFYRWKLSFEFFLKKLVDDKGNLVLISSRLKCRDQFSHWCEMPIPIRCITLNFIHLIVIIIQ